MQMEFDFDHNEESWEEYVSRIKRLPPEEIKSDVFRLSVVWDMDWTLYESVYISMGETDIESKKKEYYNNCRKKLMDNFGYTGFF